MEALSIPSSFSELVFFAIIASRLFCRIRFARHIPPDDFVDMAPNDFVDMPTDGFVDMAPDDFAGVRFADGQ